MPTIALTRTVTRHPTVTGGSSLRRFGGGAWLLLPVLCTQALAGGCGATTPPPAAPSGRMATASASTSTGTLAIRSVWVGVGIFVKLADGRVFNVHGGYDWPTVLSSEEKVYAANDPFLADMSASLRNLHEGPEISMTAAAEAIHFLTVGPVVVDPDWSDAVLTSVTRASPSSFELRLAKHGVTLTVTIARSSSNAYRPDYEHASWGRIEGHRMQSADLANVLGRARLAGGVDAKQRDLAVALLLEPSAHSAQPNRP